MKADLKSQFRQLIAEASVVAEAKTPSPESSRAGKPGSRAPVGSGDALVDVFLRKFSECKDSEDLTFAIEECRQLLERAKKTPKDKNAYKPEELRFWVLESKKGAQDLAIELNCTVQHIRKIRKEAGQHPNTGQKAA